MSLCTRCYMWQRNAPVEKSDRFSPLGNFVFLPLSYNDAMPRTFLRPAILSKLSSDKSPIERRRSERKMSKTCPKYAVFLGGSCNPTTWRQDVAVPMLKNLGISFFNPQVAHWEETLMEVEYQAKQTASVLFFVFDSSTRNVASMVEAGYMSGCQRKLILVVHPYSGPGQLINGEPISQQEYEALTSGLHMVQDLVERQGIPIFSEINHALNCTAKILKHNMWPQDLGTEDQVQPVRYPHFPLGEKLLKACGAFFNVNSSQITLADACVAFKTETGRDLSNQDLQAIVAGKKGIPLQEVSDKDLPLKEVTLSFEDFCCILSEFRNQRLEGRRLWEVLANSVMSPIQKVIDADRRCCDCWNGDWAISKHQSVNNSGMRDVYLGGSVGSRVTWRDDIAIPMLWKHGLTYFSPCVATSGRLLPMEASHIELSRLLLFVISNNTRAVSAMTLVAHYIGQGCNVVLCVQMLTDGAVIGGEELSRAAVKDYNRGRSYLIDQANRDGIPVFDNIQEAVECVIQKCQAR